MSYVDKIKEIEAHYQQKPKEPFSFNEKPFYYVVPMFPYPSGNIHMGHIRNYTISNVIARYKKTLGFNVLHPIGFDSFGLPAEAAAIKNGFIPQEWTEQNIGKMVADFKAMGFDFDWSNTLQTHQFDYYKFEQDIFKKAWQSGLIYKKSQYVNYDPVDHTILSNEQVKDGKGWRSGAAVVRKKMPMYFFNMKRYAHELHEGLKALEGSWPRKVLEMQRHWIGIKPGHNVTFAFSNETIDVFKFANIQETQPVNVITVGINHPFAQKFEKDAMFQKWFEQSSSGSISQKDNFNKKQWYATSYAVKWECSTVPVFIDINGDDEAVFAYAKDMDVSGAPIADAVDMQQSWQEESKDRSIYHEVGLMQSMKEAVFIGLKDWCISRQRYWGNPIPMVSCTACGDIPSDGHVKLPTNLKPDGQGNILEKTPSFHECACPQCGHKAQRCTDTMDTFVQSSWYYHRYINPQAQEMIDKPHSQIDIYIGGVEHATMHLIYTRFFHKMLRDFGFVSTDEPIKKLMTQGMVCKKYQKPDGTMASAKMSKSIGNVVAPQEYINQYGADALQMFIIFAAPPSDNFDFEDSGIVGCYRFLEEVYNYFFESNANVPKKYNDQQALQAVHRLNHYIEKEFEGRGNFNTVIPQLMVAFKQIKRTSFAAIKTKQEIENKFIQSLGIFAPHLSQYIKDFVLEKDLSSTNKPKSCA